MNDYFKKKKKVLPSNANDDKRSSDSSEEFRTDLLKRRSTYVKHKRNKYKINSFSKFLKDANSDFVDRFGTLISDNNTSIKDFKLTRVIGKDEFSLIVLAYFKPQSEYYALKIAKKETLVKNNKVHKIFRERDIVGAVHFDFILSMDFCFMDYGYVYLALHYIPGGDLFSYLKKCEKFDENQAKFYAAQVYLGLEYLHYLNIIYRDLKPELILIDSRGYIKLSNFSTSKLRKKTRTYSFCGTPDYVAPEMILGTGHGLAVDWWAFGVFVYEMIEGDTPFHAGNNTTLEQFENIMNSKYKFSTNFSEDACDLIHQLLQVDLTKRLGNLKHQGADVKKHRWFNEIDFKAIMNCFATAPYIPTVKASDDSSNFPKYDSHQLIIPAEDLYAKQFKNF